MEGGSQQQTLQENAARRRASSCRTGFGHLRRSFGKIILSELRSECTGLIDPVPRVYLSAQVLKTGVVLADLPGTSTGRSSLT